MPSLLSTGSNALLAFQRALSTVSHNVANVATDGYSRQRVNLSARPGENYGTGYIGAGVQVDGITRLADGLNFARRLDSGGELGRLTQISTLSTRVDSLFSDKATGLSTPWSSFFDSVQGVSAEPASPAARQSLLAGGQSLVARLGSLNDQLQGLERDVNAKLRGGIDEVNRVSSEVAKLNESIARSTGTPSPDLLDQREQLVARLGSLVGASTVMQDDGAMNVFTAGGQPLVLGTRATALVAAPDPFGLGRVEIALDTSGGQVRLGNGAVSGELGGLLDFRQQMLDPTSAELGRVAVGLADGFNEQHRAGTDFYGNPGANFFTLPTPAIASHQANTGSATLATAISDVSALDGANVTLKYNGSTWSATRADTGAAVPLTGTGTAADPLVVNGVSVTVGGAAAAGDRFLLQPTSGAAGGVKLAITDPNRIAAAAAVRTSADVSNIGTGRVSGLTVTDATNPSLRAPVDLVFVDANNYTLNGSGPFPYTAGGTVTGNGWSMTLDGAPRAGDAFRVRATGAGSSDNGNARVLGNFDDANTLDGGARSLNGAISQLTVTIGSVTRQAGFSREGAEVIQTDLQAQREAVSGVNLDEEAADLLRYQQAYQAAAQIISTADTLFQSLLSAVRR